MPHLAGTIWKSTLLGRNLNPSVSSTPGRSDDRAASCGRADYGGCDWAWEFLRRNADYIADWRSSVPQQLPCITLRDGTKLLRLRRRFPRAEKWGLHAFADPKLCAHKANVFWHAKALKQVVRLNAKGPTEGDEARVRRLADFNADRQAVINADGVPLVMMKRNGICVPLEISGLSNLTAPFVPVIELHDLDDLSAQTELLKRLQRFTEADFRAIQKPFASDERLHHALVALDECLKGKTYRQIAIAIFGEKKVAEDWHGHSQFLRDRTRRLVAKGTELMKGGYRDLLG
ncbi:DUF2285 domain-containing protein [Bradyrhizobium sp. SHOUNA76]|uniref:DUF2285 domain-containing protein n=1 Tax=Bradyrhizobium sp. SHOUNA76 TaxID=2908927 RepID=UPI001FF246D9|nr:DUF2285 domain-containing protein [Bradyrhizobium sp. SHOUNA76]MCJ9700840.1 DUF2285 domain-containing protein [Bradyrhizobium sp. SHOUNA76]